MSLAAAVALVRRTMSTRARTLVAVCQMNCTHDKEANWAMGKRLVERAAGHGAKMAFLPECFDYIGRTMEETKELALKPEDGYIARYRELARSLGIWLSLGGYHETPGIPDPANRAYNNHSVIDPAGEVVGEYHKTHVFDLDIPGRVSTRESDFTIPGDGVAPVVETSAGRLGLAICYDMRFPELARIMRRNGAEILAYPSAFTVVTGLAHWEAILRTRAIETQCYVVAAAQAGKHNDKRSSYGHALVVDPWGAVIAHCSGDGEALALAEIDLPRLDEVREQMTLESHRRNDVYGTVQLKKFNHPPHAQQPQPAPFQFGSRVLIPSEQIFCETQLTVAFVNHKPVLPGHVLIGPRRYCQKLPDLSDAEVFDMFRLAQRVQRVLEKHYSTQSSTVAVQDGPDSGQTVDHVHIHILPRKQGDFAHTDEVYAELAKHDHDERPARSSEEMAKEASLFRELMNRE